MALKLKIGSPVAGEDFFGRNAELKKAEILIEDNNLMLAAPRRVGKTSFAKKLMEVQSAKGWNTIFVDLEEITSVEHFFKTFYDELMTLPDAKLKDKITSKVKKWLSGMELSTSGLPVKATVKIGIPGNDDFKELAEVLSMLDNHTLIVFDELTVLLESLSAMDDGDQMVRTFLNQSRALRSATTAKCSWLVCSSVGVRNFTTQHNLSDTINDIADFDLGAFSEEEAIEFIGILAHSIGIEMDKEMIHYLLGKIGWNIPYFIQLVLSRLPVGKISGADIDDAYDGLLQTGSFDTWHERLNKEYGKNKDAAKLVLQYLCVNASGKSKEDICNHVCAKYPSIENDEFGLLLRALITDGYLVRTDNLYRFRSPLLRDYWKVTYS